MKHPKTVTLILLGLFLLTHLIGLYIVNEFNKTDELPYGIERPELDTTKPVQSTGYIVLFIIIATGLVLLLAHFKLGFMWKLWFGIAIALTLAVSFSVFMPALIALIVAIILAVIRVFWKNVYIHNFTELFIYGAIAAIFAPILTEVIAIIILVLISIYDFIAVNKTKHMVKLAKFQTKEKLFAGFMIPYKKETAILGGGDVSFPLIFAGILLPKFGVWSFLISIGALAGLGVLFYLAKKKKYYPAMPFITVGCLIAYGIILLIF